MMTSHSAVSVARWCVATGGEGGDGYSGGEGRAHFTLLVTPVRPSAVWRWISAHEIRLSVGSKGGGEG